MKPHVVDVQNVHKRFGSTVAVDGVSLSVGEAEFVTLLGPSGCGKTTILRLIAGFEYPDLGRVFLGGTDVTDTPAHRRDVHTVFQNYALFPHLSVSGNVAFGLYRKGFDKAESARRVRDVLELVRLPDLADRFPGQLSGGQQQRVAIARAIVLEPRVLLLDEPLAALDRKLREEMQVELKALQRRLGISFVFVTHDQDEALAMSDRVVVMNQGRIEQAGSPKEVYELPSTRFTADFVGVTNVLSGRIVANNGEGTVLETPAGRVRVDGVHAIGDEVQLAVRPEKVRFVDVADPWCIRATVEEALYLGDVTHWYVRLADGSRWTVFAQNDGSERDAGPGTEVGVAWDVRFGVPLK
jgi:spermidine/putrescine ABC transporter ATP-binding subunit